MHASAVVCTLGRWCTRERSRTHASAVACTHNPVARAQGYTHMHTLPANLYHMFACTRTRIYPPAASCLRTHQNLSAHSHTIHAERGVEEERAAAERGRPAPDRESAGVRAGEPRHADVAADGPGQQNQAAAAGQESAGGCREGGAAPPSCLDLNPQPQPWTPNPEP